jgi:hypothetical protein
MPDESETILSNIAERLNVRALMMRWLAVRETRVVESDHLIEAEVGEPCSDDTFGVFGLRVNP